VLERDDSVAGYGILSVAGGEAHILNLCVDPNYRSYGYGERMLDEILLLARAVGVRQIFLEVRPSNRTALALYKKKGFHLVANRPSYYQAREGREDAAVLAKKLIIDDQ
jgi:ribosomal-protein-alanine N-acetyltransferase